MNISKLIFALVFTLSLSFNSFATTPNTTGDTNEFTTTFSAKINNQATANIKNNQGTVIVTLTNEQGNILQERTITSKNIKYTISLESLPKGTYFLQVRGNEKSSYQTYYVN